MYPSGYEPPDVRESAQLTNSGANELGLRMTIDIAQAMIGMGLEEQKTYSVLKLRYGSCRQRSCQRNQLQLRQEGRAM
jgi:hypothetical protein